MSDDEELEEEEEEEEVVEETSIDQLEELEGVGPATAKRLVEAGYTTLESLVLATSSELAAATGITEAAAKKIIAAARKKLNVEVMSAYDYYVQRRSVKRITTGSKGLDDLLGGGIETQAITEIYGPYGSGKTQLCHQLSVTVQLPEDKGGLGKTALFIDTEGTFRPERIVQIAERFGLDPETALKNIMYARAFTSDHQMIVTEKAEPFIKERNVGLIVVDSLISHFRGEYVGRESLAARQQRLNKYLHKLLKLALGYNAAVLVTNQVVADPSVFFGDPNKPAGGHILGHGVTARLYIRRSKKGLRQITLVKSPYLPEDSVEVKITEHGIEDA
ncbi:MAG: DNA repair and recombination protein RadA [Thermoproteota archaeon]|jgi:DNA repair protein RadA|uniref:DNA repair and recombination protein RadA n=1 Tax=Candidatus Methanodesulfokora washburnensis TaxID=2478471 RepID=A0A429GQ17_9CREN|nr:DNA repair and recombination protein RadA [Candidatus Methanodesulfokores washburnensis]RSN75965.1 DNA repair and recombination protein RadA [Candidatus Methanodesulfokores washburnensis]RZN62618.1 MAG: DNA repair and recombination protein RadA [Candidatus Methanodesulfokores washburnensis]TDA42011.1 MAG: DNA repair and recombination protein RadA [Candidatus Korarchaeota archaeon]